MGIAAAESLRVRTLVVGQQRLDLAAEIVVVTAASSRNAG